MSPSIAVPVVLRVKKLFERSKNWVVKQSYANVMFSDQAAVEKMVADTVAAFGGLDLFVSQCV